MRIKRVISACLCAALCTAAMAQDHTRAGEEILEEITIIGNADDVITSTGAAYVLDAEELDKFAYADIQQILRDVPGVSIQLEDGYGLRPNLSIRGTATERSGRITLLEDNVLIAPAPYSAPSAYYFPTAGRMHQMEVLKGSSAIRQGPYTVGGSVNLVSTPVPENAAGMMNVELGSDSTSRVHAHYGDSELNYGWLIEGHLWDSNGFQEIDFSDSDTGLNKDDWMTKFRVNSDPGDPVYHQLDLKLQLAEERSNQSYLGLTDNDFSAQPNRRYAVSQLDNIETRHDQVVLRYLVSFQNRFELTTTAYSNNHERNWFKTEGLDPDGSTSAEDFSRTSWFNVIQALNSGNTLGGLSATQLQSILDGGDTADGAIQVRSNAREYYSRGVQFGLSWDQSIGNQEHEFEFGLRFHEDQEDRLQRNSTYTLQDGVMVLADAGLLGNAGNRVQDAKATSFHIYDRITLGNLVLTPGIRYENIDQSRTRWETRPGITTDPGSRSDDNLRSMRENSSEVWLPGMGVLYAVSEQTSVYGGVHKGFTAPTNAPDVREEESINYEAGVRYNTDTFSLDSAVFLTDYDNLLGVCTASSGSDCVIGSAFNGDAASILGLELHVAGNMSRTDAFSIPVSFSYTWLDGEFDSNIADTSFFGDVSEGDRLPYIPEHQWLLSVGYEQERWAAYVRGNYVGDVCVRASCQAFESSDKFLNVDVSLHYEMNSRLSLYGRIDNVADEKAIVARQPYGARPLKERAYMLGFKFNL